MAQQAIVSPYLPEDRESLLCLWRRFFGDSSAARLQARWGWQFESNPYLRERDALILVAKLGKDVVGHISAFPLPIILEGERKVVLCASGLVVSEEHRWLAMKLVGAFAKRAPVMASGMDASLRKIFAHFGGEIVDLSQDRFTYRLRYDGEICRDLRRHLRRPLTPLLTPRIAGALLSWRWRKRCGPAGKALPPRPRDARLHRLESFDGVYDRFWSQVRRQFRSCLEKDSTYMNWRYRDCPTQHSYCLGCFDEDGSLSGIVIALLRTERDWTGRPCVLNGEIVELLHLDPNSQQIETLLVSAVHELKRARIDTITAMGLRVDYYPLFERLGFVQEQTDTFAIAVSLSGRRGKSSCSMEKEEWYAGAGDGDSLFNPAI